MAFESLSHNKTLEFEGFPVQWFPLTHLYDPDLPLFPLLYFHALDPKLPLETRPGEHDRIFGFVQHIGLQNGKLSATVVLNKNLDDSQNAQYLTVIRELVSNRLGLADPITEPQIRNTMVGPLAGANSVLLELWHKIVTPAFGGKLPFGHMWDEVFGLIRFIASWNSQGGRKGELIQTHYFLSSFGENVPTATGISASFYLLPTFSELQDATNPLSVFPKFRNLTLAADKFVGAYCTTKTGRSSRFSAFSMSKAGLSGQLDTEKILLLINRETGQLKNALFENYSAFNRGPARSVLALMMFHNLRNQYWNPQTLTPQACAEMYDNLSGTYQSPKVMQLYAQQCFGSECALPIDNWVKTFVRWPLSFNPSKKSDFYGDLFSASASWGRVERLIWMAAQSRKVHTSVAADILWCIRYGTSGDKGPKMRGAAPLSCLICDTRIRNCCPAYAEIKSKTVSFNSPGADFQIGTSAGNSSSAGQAFVSCRSAECIDEYSSRDRPASFLPYPQLGSSVAFITVAEFIAQYSAS